MPRGGSYELAGWDEDRPPRTCARCEYSIGHLESRCPRCGWAEGDEVADDDLGPDYEELKAEQRAAGLAWQRCVWASAMTVCVASPVGYVLGQATTEGPLGGAIFGAFIGGVVAGVVSRLSEPLVGGVIGAVWALIYLLGAIMGLAIITQIMLPSTDLLVIIAFSGGSAAALGSAAFLSQEQSVF